MPKIRFLILILAFLSYSACEPRVASLNHRYTEILIALDIVPVAAIDIDEYKKFVDFKSYVLDEARNIDSKKLYFHNNIDTISSAKPDIIIGQDSEISNSFKRLNDVGKVIALKEPYANISGEKDFDAVVNLRKQIMIIASALGIKEKGYALVKKLNSTIDNNSKILKRLQLNRQENIAYISTVEYSPVIYLYPKGSLIFGILKNMGLNPYRINDGLYPVHERDYSWIKSFKGTIIVNMVEPIETHDPVINKNAVFNKGDTSIINIRYPGWSFGGPISAMRISDTITSALQIASDHSQQQ